MARDLPTGVFSTAKGYRVFVRLSRDRLVTETFPATATLPEMKQWRETTRADFKRAPKDAPPPSEGFAQDVETYLKAVAHMTSFTDRQRDIQWWIGIFGERPRDQISSHEIAAALAGCTLSASTLNHRRSALAHLWRVLDGKAARNPVRDVPKRREPDAEPRGMPYTTIRRIFAAMPDSATKARLMVLAYTGIPPAQQKRIQPADIELNKTRVYVRGRQKGHGTKGRWVPLSPEGVLAFKAFMRHEAFGAFDRKYLWTLFRRACNTVDPITLVGVRPYDLRHSFGEQVYAASGDIRATQILMGHSRPEMTHRYTIGAVDEQVGKALAAFTLRTRNQSRRKVTRKVTHRE